MYTHLYLYIHNASADDYVHIQLVENSYLKMYTYPFRVYI